MGKLTNVRERVHQNFYDHAWRTAGYGGVPTVGDRIQLFTNRARGTDQIDAVTNVDGAVLNSDQSFVILALQAWHIYRRPVERGTVTDSLLSSNGDYSAGLVTPFWTTGPGAGQAPAGPLDVLRIHQQTLEGLHWSVGTGEKFSLVNVQHQQLPAGMGGWGNIGTVSDVIVGNGDPSLSTLFRLARAVLLPPRQNFKVEANLYSLPTGGQDQAAGLVQGSRNMYSLRDNVNCVDGMTKTCGINLAGLHARDVQ